MTANNTATTPARSSVADCTCGRLHVGLVATNARNWNPRCAGHGTESAWYNSDAQRAARAAQNDRAIDAQQRAREARAARRDQAGT